MSFTHKIVGKIIGDKHSKNSQPTLRLCDTCGEPSQEFYEDKHVKLHPPQKRYKCKNCHNN